MQQAATKFIQYFPLPPTARIYSKQRWQFCVISFYETKCRHKYCTFNHSSNSEQHNIPISEIGKVFGVRSFFGSPPSLAHRTPFFLASHFNILSYISFDQICEAKILLPFNKIMAYLDWSQIFPFDIRVSHRVTTPVYATHKTNRQANGIEPTNKRKVNVTQTR